MMSGEQLGIAQEPRYRTAYVNSWTNALKNGPAGGSGPRPSMRSGCPTGCSGAGRGTVHRWRAARTATEPPAASHARTTACEAEPLAARAPSTPEHDAPRPEVGPSR